MLFNALTRPHLIFDQLNQRSSLEAALLVLLGAGMLPLLAPRLLPPLAVLVAVPLLAQHEAQRTLSLHYMVVPATFALLLAAVALKSSVLGSSLPQVIGKRLSGPSAAGMVILACAVAVFAWKSPLPPSFAAETGRFQVDSHARLARSFVDMVPDDVPVSAQAAYVPHLSQRRDIFEFPRVEDAAWVLLDEKRPVPSYDAPRFDGCLRELPSLGFQIIRREDGITLWRRTAQTGRATACQ